MKNNGKPTCSVCSHRIAEKTHFEKKKKIVAEAEENPTLWHHGSAAEPHGRRSQQCYSIDTFWRGANKGWADSMNNFERYGFFLSFLAVLFG
jgi:hypothetical protein